MTSYKDVLGNPEKHYPDLHALPDGYVPPGSLC
jgi:hypothetical protein